MNILIVGNGFDLSHYLPTKYEHFMSVMKNIENWSKPNENMYFDDLFEKEDRFFQKTKSIYQAEKICISNLDIEKLKDKLQKIFGTNFSDTIYIKLIHGSILNWSFPKH